MLLFLLNENYKLNANMNEFESKKISVHFHQYPRIFNASNSFNLPALFHPGISSSSKLFSVQNSNSTLSQEPLNSSSSLSSSTLSMTLSDKTSPLDSSSYKKNDVFSSSSSLNHSLESVSLSKNSSGRGNIVNKLTKGSSSSSLDDLPHGESGPQGGVTGIGEPVGLQSQLSDRKILAKQTLSEFMNQSTSTNFLTREEQEEIDEDKILIDNNEKGMKIDDFYSKVQSHPPMTHSDHSSIIEVYDALINFIFPDIYQKRRFDKNKVTSSAPHHQPLKRRFAHLKWKESKREKRFTNEISLVDKFKDVKPTTVLKLHPYGFVLSSQDTVYPYSNPLVQKWLEYFDDSSLYTEIVDVYPFFENPQYYDGCIFGEFWDYREMSGQWPFGPPADVATTNDSVANLTPRKNKIIFKPNESTFMSDLFQLMDDTFGPTCWTDDQYLLMEQKLHVILSSPLCLDPSPQVSRLLNFFYYQRGKFRRFRESPFERAKHFRESEEENRKRRIGYNILEDSKEKDNYLDRIAQYGFFGVSQTYPFKQHILIAEIKEIKKSRSAEFLAGLDFKQVHSSALKVSLDIPIQKIYRTVRMETEVSLAYLEKKSGITKMALNIYPSTEGGPECMLRVNIVDKKFHVDEVKSFKFKLSSPYIVEEYINSLKRLIMMEDASMKCITDLTNPSAWLLLFKPH